MLLHHRSSCSILYLLFTWFLGLCYGFVLLSSAAGQNGGLNMFEPGDSLSYKFYTSVLLQEKAEESKDVGFYIDGVVALDVLWEKDERKLLKLSLRQPQLHIKSRKAPSPDGFVPHWSKLEDANIKPALVIWKNGLIEEISLPKGELTSISNLKKGIASLFQFQPKEESSELDASGKCTVKYTSQSPSTFLKIKSNCFSEDFQRIANPDDLLKVNVASSRKTEYKLNPSDSYFQHVKSEERHLSFLAMKTEVGNQIDCEQTLSFVTKEKVDVLEDATIEAAVQKVEKAEGVTFTRENLLTEKESPQTGDQVKFTKLVASLRDYLKTDHSGKLKSSKAFLKLVKAARLSTKEDFAKGLSGHKNKQILPQLIDVLGNVQTEASHEAIMKLVHFEKEEDLDLSERYLWALSFSSQPNPEIIKHLMKKYTKLVNIPQKVKETLVLTIASMTYKLDRMDQKRMNHKLFREVEETILKHLEYNKGDDKLLYFRALQNLKSPTTIPTLLDYIKKGSQKEGVLAWKALKSFDETYWNEDVLKAAEKSFFQLDKKYDSSSRTLAADILLESQPSDDLLRKMLKFLLSNDPNYEIKQYVLQRIRMIADADPNFKKRVQSFVRADDKLNNYSGLAPRGLSVALTRRFMSGPSSNGSLVTVQEMKSGIVKRGSVNVLLENGDVTEEIFSLGIFSGGLNSLMSSDSETDEANDDAVTAGMELTVLGTQVRPFVFFNGQGELMGHVWSGTATDLTPAFQVLLMLQDHMEFLRLGSGFIATVDIKGSTSLDLSGKIDISIWNRNAESLVKKSAGMLAIGTTTVDTMFVKSEVEFSISTEAELNLQSDIDFSSNMRVCMRLTQPDNVFRHNIFKIERIPGSKHRIRISKYKKYNVHGTTYSINRKNNEMCSAIFS